MAMSLPPKSCPFAWGSGPPSNICFLGPPWAQMPNGIWISSPVFAQLTAECRYTLQRAALPPSKLPLPMGMWTPSNKGSLGPPKSSPKRHLNCLNCFCRAHYLWQACIRAILARVPSGPIFRRIGESVRSESGPRCCWTAHTCVRPGGQRWWAARLAVSTTVPQHGIVHCLSTDRQNWCMLGKLYTVSFSFCSCSFAFSALTLLVGRQEGHPARKKIGGWWRWALLSLDGVAPCRMVGVSASLNLPLHHKDQRFSSGTDSPGWSQKRDCKTVVVWWYHPEKGL